MNFVARAWSEFLQRNSIAASEARLIIEDPSDVVRQALVMEGELMARGGRSLYHTDGNVIRVQGIDIEIRKQTSK